MHTAPAGRQRSEGSPYRSANAAGPPLSAGPEQEDARRARTARLELSHPRAGATPHEAGWHAYLSRDGCRSRPDDGRAPAPRQGQGLDELRARWHGVDDDGIVAFEVDDPDLEQRAVGGGADGVAHGVLDVLVGYSVLPCWLGDAAPRLVPRRRLCHQTAPQLQPPVSGRSVIASAPPVHLVRLATRRLVQSPESWRVLGSLECEAF